MYPDTDLGENARHGEVFDEQAETYVFPGVSLTDLTIQNADTATVTTIANAFCRPIMIG